MIRIKNPTPARLPSEYQELDYIQSTGTQYIDTGAYGSNNTKIEINYNDDGGSTVVFYCGARATSYEDKALFMARNNATAISVNQASTGQIFAGTKTVTIGTTNHTQILDKGKWYYDGTSMGATPKTTSFTTPYTLRLFGSCNNGTMSALASIKLWYCKIWENDVLVRDFVPCYRKSDNEPGMYDLVNNVFYTNAGSGTFLMGNEVGKRDINIDPNIVDTPLLRRYVQGKLVYGEEPIKGRFVAVGENGKSYYSEDGETWATMSGGSSYDDFGVAYGNGRFVKVGRYGDSYYSTDGVNWVAMTGLASALYYGVTYGNDRFVCVGASGKSYYSTDGKTWAAMSGLSSSYTYNAVTYGNGRFVAVGASSKSYYSTDGKTWAAMSGLSSSYTYNAVTYGNGRFVAVSDGYIYYSTDGASWTAAQKMSNTKYGVAYGNGKFVTVGSSGYTYYSTDGASWTRGGDLSSNAFYGVVYGNDRFVAVGENGKSYYSTDGINWVAMTGLASATYQGVCYGEI